MRSQVGAIGLQSAGRHSVVQPAENQVTLRNPIRAGGLAALLSLTMLQTLPGIQPKVALWAALTLAIASHGGLDAMTTYGEGVEFLAPWTTTRYWAPWSVLGGGIVRDSIAFALCYALARTVIVRRGLPLPRLLNPRFLQPAV